MISKLSIFLILILVVLSCKTSNNKGEDFKLEKPLLEIIKEKGIQPNELSILIDKSNFTLSVLTKEDVVKTYPIVLGTNPVDDKRMEGDRSTPEGKFKVRDYYPHAKWSKFIWIDYPTRESWRKYNASIEAGEIPREATIGGEIGIHGVPYGKDYLIDQKVNWTWGCISLTNVDVEDLYNVVYKGMEIEITP